MAAPNFVSNERQWPEQVKYRADLPGGAVFFTSNRFVYSYYSHEDMQKVHDHMDQKKGAAQEVVRGHAYEVSFAGCNQGAKITGNEQQNWYQNYFLGRDSSRWAAHVPVYGGITYGGLYPGVDLAVYGKGNAMKYDFVVAAGADASVIRLHFNGVKPRLTSGGAIEIRTSVNTVYEEAPYAYQVSGGTEKKVNCRYQMNSRGEVTFEFPDGYDRKLPLVIDPTLVFATFSGATGDNRGTTVTYDQAGNVYALSRLSTVGWPVTMGAFQTTGSTGDIGINKYNATGTALIYSTCLGGSGNDRLTRSVVNSANELIIFGNSSSANFPVTAGCYDNTIAIDPDFFVTHFNATGTALIGSTYIGGSNFETAGIGDVAVDPSGNIVCASSTASSDFPVTAGVYQPILSGSNNGCIFKLNPVCSSLLMSTYLGGSGMDYLYALQLASNGNIVVCGITDGNGFPTTPGTANPVYQGGGGDGFVSILDPSGVSLLQSTLLGTPFYDYASQLQLDDSNNVYVAGYTQGSYPVTPGAYTNIDGTVFIHVLSPTLTHVMSTRVGPSMPFSEQGPQAFLVDDCKSISYFVNLTDTTTLPVTPNAYQNTGGLYIAQLTPGLASLNYATFLGPPDGVYTFGLSAFDKQGNLYATLCTRAFTTTPGTWSPASQTGSISTSINDALTFKFHIDALTVPEASFGIGGDDTGCAPFTVSFTNNSGNAVSYLWTFGDGGTSTASAPTHTYTTPGTYYVKLTAYDPASCKTSDIDSLPVYVLPADTVFTSSDSSLCHPGALVLQAPAGYATHQWQNSSTNTSLTVTEGGNFFVVSTSADLCSRRIDSFSVEKIDLAFSLGPDAIVCPPHQLKGPSIDGAAYQWKDGSTAQQINIPAPGTYWVTVTKGICSQSDTINVIYDKYCDCQLSVPSAFSPNEDGRNDVFRVLAPGGCPLSGFTLSVYNRWGQRVFVTTDHRKGWDGTFNGVPADQGTYMYVVDGYAGSKGVHKQQTGDVMLVR